MTQNLARVEHLTRLENDCLSQANALSAKRKPARADDAHADKLRKLANVYKDMANSEKRNV